MAEGIKYFIDGKEFLTPVPQRKVADLLAEVDLTVEDAVLVLPDGSEQGDPSASIDIHDGDKFTTKPKSTSDKGDGIICYKVNGEEQKTTSSKRTVEEILRDAGKDASVDVDELSSYYLESLVPRHRYESLNEVVEILDGSQFLAVYRSKTPVA